jgi:tetratricopeptide (TPR) repeat protein
MRLPGRLLVTGFVLAATTPALLPAQTVDEHVAMGVELFTKRLDPKGALQHYEAALALDSLSYDANWRAAQALVDIGKEVPDETKDPARDSAYAKAERYARVAVTVNPNGADGWYVLAAAIGRASLTKGKKERVKRAGEIRSAALRSIELNPNEDGAYHIMGRWNAEIMRLSGFNRFFAKTFLGGAIFNAAAWDSATIYMARAVELRPEWIYHRLDYAEILVDVDQFSLARVELQKVAELPVGDAMDPEYKKTGAALMTKIEGEKDKTRD